MQQPNYCEGEKSELVVCLGAGCYNKHETSMCTPEPAFTEITMECARGPTSCKVHLRKLPSGILLA